MDQNLTKVDLNVDYNDNFLKYDRSFRFIYIFFVKFTYISLFSMRLFYLKGFYAFFVLQWLTNFSVIWITFLAHFPPNLENELIW